LMKLLEEKNEKESKPIREISTLVPTKHVSHIRKRSTLPLGVVQMLVEVPQFDEDEGDNFDEKDTADVCESEIDAEIQQEIEHARGEKEAVAAVLGIEKEEYIRKSTYFSHNSTTFNDTIPDRLVTINNQPGISETFTYADDVPKPKNQENKPIDFEQDHIATINLNPNQLAERCEVLESMLEAEKALNGAYLYSQQVIIDHLAETNEGLLNFFRVKYKVFLGDGKKKKKKTKKKKKPTQL